MSASNQDRLLTFIIYVFVFMLLREWLKPVIVLTETNYMGLFLLFIGISFLFYFIGLSWKIVIPIKMLLIGWVVVYIYADVSFFSREGWSFLGQVFMTNIEAVMRGDWTAITDPFRTALFYVLLWMAAYLINYWIMIRKSLLLFFVLTVLFVTILDTFSPYNGKTGIIITLTSGFMIMGLLYAKKLMEEHGLENKGKFLFSVVTSLFLILGLSGGVAYLLPKAAPIWPDPVPFFTSSSLDAVGRGGNGGTLRKVGYGDNDEKLGGAFASDDTLVFQAVSSSRQYWKVETKDTYTSKGWVNSEEPPYDSITIPTGTSFLQDVNPGPIENTEIASINMIRDFPYVVQPYGISRIHAGSETSYSLTVFNQQIGPTDGQTTSLPKQYEIEFSEPEYSLTELRATNLNGVEELGEDLDRYLQLPDTLPQRVRDLAEQVTSTEDNLYEKAKRIERYFRQNGFSYNQNEAAIPTGDTDYVDQFLFDTKIGYCDNFSTSMVVMLRSIGVPARWVKGFAPGEDFEKTGDMTVYQVTNNNAHSWVEAYLPGIGWMPFEPTIGFTNYANIDYDVERQTEVTSPVMEKPEQAPERPEEATNQQKATSKTFTERMESVVDWVDYHKAAVIWSIVGLILLALIFYHYRRKWIAKILIPSYRIRAKDWKTFERMYHQLLKQLASYGYKRSQGQTLMDFAKSVDESFGENHMKRLTKEYEKGFYGNNKNELNFKVLRESWENLINQLGS